MKRLRIPSTDTQPTELDVQNGKQDAPAGAREDPGLAVFLLPRQGLRRGGVARLVSMLELHGFEIVRTKHLTVRESKRAARLIGRETRGRRLGKRRGGPPVAAVVAYDVEPIRLTAYRKLRFPQVTNARVLLRRTMCRAMRRDYPEWGRRRVIDSSDNGRQALEYIGILMPESAAEIKSRIEEIRQAYRTAQPVVKTLTRNGRRAKVEVIEYAGGLAVKKTFKSYQRRHGRREAAAMRQLNPLIPQIPPPLASNRYSVVLPYYDDVLQYSKSSGKLFPLRVAKQAIEVLRKVYEAGFALIDASVENIIVDRKLGLRLIDLEFAYRYGNKPPSFRQSYDIAGRPEDFDGDLPSSGGTSYAEDWQPYVGLSLDSLLHDPEWLQQVKRFGYYLAHLPRFLPRRIRHYFRHCGRALRALVQRSTGVKPEPRIPSAVEHGHSSTKSEDTRYGRVA